MNLLDVIIRGGQVCYLPGTIQYFDWRLENENLFLFWCANYPSPKWAYGKAGNGKKQKLETEIGNGSGSKKVHQSLVQCFFIVCLVITLVFNLVIVMGLAVWVTSFAFTPVLCFVITAFSVKE